MDEKYANARRLSEKFTQLNRLTHRIRVAGSVPNGVFGILAVIDKHCRHTGETGIRLGRLCVALHRSMPSITRSVNALEAEGLVTKAASSSDRRAVYVSLTDSGRQVLQRSIDARDSLMEEVLARLGQADSDRLMELLDRLSAIMDEMNGETPQSKEKTHD